MAKKLTSREKKTLLDILNSLIVSTESDIDADLYDEIRKKVEKM